MNCHTVPTSGILCAAAALLLSACASPALRLDDAARGLGLERRVIAGAGFEHVAYARPAVTPGEVLHVYLDGDGTPWLQGRWPAVDPTPRDSLVLRLAARDPAAVYLGRPCYLGAGPPGRCHPDLWTGARYGDEVVASMTAALAALSAGRGAREVVLVGFSGGGALAMLVAERAAAVTAVVTIAGNLDVASWARLHGYLPLTGSLDPARRPSLPSRVRQVHFAGAGDGNVPPALIAPAVARQAQAKLIVVPGYGHACCWLQDWPGLLERALGPPA